MYLLGLWLLLVGSAHGLSQTAAPQLNQVATAAFAHQTTITTLAFSPNGDWLASGDKQGTVLIWKLPEYGPSHRVKLDDVVHQLIFDRESRRLLVVAGTKVNSIAVNDPNDRQDIPVPPYGYSQTVKVRLSPDGKTLAMGRGHLYLYDYPRLTLTKTYPYAEENRPIVEFENLAFRPDGKELAVMLGSVAPIDQINLNDGSVQQGLVVEGDPITHSWVTRRAMGYSRDGRLLAVSNNHGVWLYQMDIGTAKKFWGHRDLIHALAFTADGQTLISAGADQQIIGRALPSGRQKFVWQAPASVRTLAVSPDGAMLASAGVDQAISLWSLTDAKRTEPMKVLGNPIQTVNHRTAQHIPYALRKMQFWTYMHLGLLFLLLIATGMKGAGKAVSQVRVVLFLGFFLGLKIALFFVLDTNIANLTPVGAQSTRKLVIHLVYYAFTIIGGTGLCSELGWRPSFFFQAGNPQPTPRWRQRSFRAVAEGAALLVLLLVYSWLILYTFQPVDFTLRVTNPSKIFVVMPSIDEEIIFRLGLFTGFAYWLKKYRWGTQSAAVLSSLLFAFIHLFNLDPLWVKWLQVFPIGLALCWLYRRHGIEVPILVHIVFNIVQNF